MPVGHDDAGGPVAGGRVAATRIAVTLGLQDLVLIGQVDEDAVVARRRRERFPVQVDG